VAFNIEELKRSLAAQAAAVIREKLGSIRDPDTGEFPTVLVLGESPDDLFVRAEASASLLELVQQRLREENVEDVHMASVDVPRPIVFLSWASENRDTAERLANIFMASGIDTWWSEWEMKSGDSLRRRVDEGLGRCTHFVALLTPESIGKPWVNEEMDAGFIRKVGQQARFIPVRERLPVRDLPPLLSAVLSPSIDDFDDAALQIISDIHGVSRKPPLGSSPTPATLPRTSHSPAATACAKVFVERTPNGMRSDVQLTTQDLATAAGLTEADCSDALHELRHFVQAQWDTVWAHASLYAEFDRFFRAWNPEADALKLAADLVNDASFPTEASAIAARYGWEPRRLNPAVAWLFDRALIQDQRVLSSGTWEMLYVEKIDATRRFVKSRS